jgi:hypothetical protein
MGKKKAKSGGSSTPAVTVVAVSGGVFLLRRLLAFAWTKITGKVPPTDLTDPKVTLTEALAWSVATGIVVESARYFIMHAAARRKVTEAAGDEG